VRTDSTVGEILHFPLPIKIHRAMKMPSPNARVANVLNESGRPAPSRDVMVLVREPTVRLSNWPAVS
jgi:hypothetical protein